MGAVYLAEHAVLGRQVAIKFLHADYSAKEDMVNRFHREAQAAAAIHHRNIIEVFDVGLSAAGEPFLVMEYLEGESLSELLKRVGPLNLSAACAVIEAALLAVRAAHRKGIIHRDLKPDNLFLAYQTDGPPVVKLIDFGISKFTQGAYDKWRTKTGSLLGTPAYMSPEQARALPGLDHRSDLYSVGTIFYEMLTGALPFAGNSFPEYLANLLIEEPLPPRSMRADFPAEAEPVIRKALVKDPAARYQSADEMLEALQVLKGFSERFERLGMLASTNRVRGFAAGDLGPVLPGKEGSESVRAGSRLLQDATAVPPQAKRRLVFLIAGLVALIGGSAAGGWLLFGRGASTPPVPPAIRAVIPAPALAAPLPAAAAPGEPAAPWAEPTAQAQPEKAAVRAPDHGESAGKSLATASRGKARHNAVRPAGSVPAAADSSPGKSVSKGLRTGARGTKMSESFE
jgi:serine/threonine-protein kinase